jgi:hypothetical protein
MEGFAALSIAANVTQFIEYGYRIVKKSREIYNSKDGVSAAQVDAESATVRLLDFSKRLQQSLSLEDDFQGSLGNLASEKQILESICNRCINLSNELLSQFKKLEVRKDEKHRKWKSFRSALKSVWSKEEIEVVARNLKSYQTELDRCLLDSLR